MIFLHEVVCVEAEIGSLGREEKDEEIRRRERSLNKPGEMNAGARFAQPPTPQESGTPRLAETVITPFCSVGLPCHMFCNKSHQSFPSPFDT
jgi:hypothetical protein